MIRFFSRLPKRKILLICIFVSVSHLYLFPQDSPQDKIEKLFTSAQNSIQEKEWDRAESEYREVLGISLDQLGAIYSALTDYELSGRAYEEACKSTILSINPYLGLGIIYLRTGRLEEGKVLLNKMLEVNPTNSEIKHLLGKYYYMEGNFRAAARELRDAYSSNADDTGLAYTLAIAYLERREKDLAVEIFNDLIERLGESPALRVLLGRAYRETEYWPEAVAEFERAIELDSSYPRVHYNLGLTYVLWEGAAAYEQAEKELKVEIENHPDLYLPNFYLGVILTILQREDAMDYLQRAVDLNPENPDPYLYLGQIYSRKEEYDKAVETLKHSIELTKNPDRNRFQLGEVYYLLGQALVRLGNRTEAKQYLQKSQELKRLQRVAAQRTFNAKTGTYETVSEEGMTENQFRKLQVSEGAVILSEPPPDKETRRLLENNSVFFRSAAANAYQGMARLKTIQNEFHETADYLEKASYWDDSLPDLKFNLGLSYVKSDQPAKAVQPLSEVLKSDPNRTDARQLLQQLSLMLVQKKETDAALMALDSIASFFQDTAEFYVLRGQAYAQKGNYDKSLEDFRKGMQIKPNLPEVHYYAGMSLIRQGRLSDALIEFDREISRQPDHAMALYHKAFVLITQHELEEATPLLFEVIRIDPKYSEAYYQLGKIQLESGQLVLAAANLETAVSLNPRASHLFYQLSRVYHQMGRKAEAEQAIARYRELKKIEEAIRDGKIEAMP